MKSLDRNIHLLDFFTLRACHCSEVINDLAVRNLIFHQGEVTVKEIQHLISMERSISLIAVVAKLKLKMDQIDLSIQEVPPPPPEHSEPIFHRVSQLL